MADFTATKFGASEADDHQGFQDNFSLTNGPDIATPDAEIGTVGAVIADILSGPETPEGLVDDFSEENPAYDHPVDGFPDLIEDIGESCEVEKQQDSNFTEINECGSLVDKIIEDQNLDKTENNCETVINGSMVPEKIPQHERDAENGENFDPTLTEQSKQRTDDENVQTKISSNEKPEENLGTQNFQMKEDFSAIKTENIIEEKDTEPQNIIQWREDRAKKIREIDEREEIKKKEWSITAKNQLEIWDKNYHEVKEKTKAANKSKNDAFMSLESEEKDKIGYTSLDVSTSKTSNEKPDLSVWECVTKLCDLSPNNRNIKSDVSRMRLLMLQLKREGHKCPAPATKA